MLQPGDLQVASVALPEEVSSGLLSADERAGLAGRRMGQPLYAGDLVTRRQVELMTQSLGNGERLYALQMASETVSGLHLQPADQVEIVVTTNKARPEQAATRVVMPAVTIFSIGGQRSGAAFGVTTGNDAGATGGGRTTTIVLRTDDAGYQSLANAREVGDLDLALLGAESYQLPSIVTGCVSFDTSPEKSTLRQYLSSAAVWLSHVR